MNTTLVKNARIVRESRLFFAHQSVGRDLMAGMNEALERQSVPPIEFGGIEVAEGSGTGWFCTVAIGANHDPVAKYRDFEHHLRHKLPVAPQIALLKLCYVDIDRDSEARALAGEYLDLLARLTADFPATVFPAMTMPLRVHRGGPGALLRECLGRENRSRLDNQKRNEFNQWVRDGETRGALFDLAAWETTDEQGKLHVFTHRGKRFQALRKAYSSDGGHLNTHGRIVLGERFLAKLADCLGGRMCQPAALARFNNLG